MNRRRRPRILIHISMTVILQYILKTTVIDKIWSIDDDSDVIIRLGIHEYNMTWRENFYDQS